MIHIITGSINSGKSTKLLAIYKELKAGDGFILPKVYINGTYAGQQIVRLTSGASIPFSYKKNFIPVSWNEKYSYKDYSFSKEGFEFAFSIIRDIISNDISPVFIDEIGPLEIAEKGIYPLLVRLMVMEITIYITVRENLLKTVLDRFNIKSYKVIKIY